MTKFNVKIGKSSAKPGLKAPAERERKPVHPGLNLTCERDEFECRKCGTFFKLPDQEMQSCRCGLWVRPHRSDIRFIRFSSGGVLPGGDEVFAPER